MLRGCIIFIDELDAVGARAQLTEFRRTNRIDTYSKPVTHRKMALEKDYNILLLAQLMPRRVFLTGLYLAR